MDAKPYSSEWLDEIRAALPEPQPLDKWHRTLVHPSLIDTIRERFASATESVTLPPWAAIEIIGRSHIPKDRALLCDRDNNLLAVMNLTTGEVAIVPPNPFSIARRFVKEGE